MLELKDNVRKAIGFMARFSSQYPLAVAKALTDTARQVSLVMPEKLRQDIDKPTPFTERAFGWRRADKETLTAAVEIKPIQAEYLRWQIEGGVRKPERKRLKLPSEISVDVYGNIPRGVVRQLVRRAEQGKGVTKRLGIKAGISTQAGLFYGAPKGGKGRALPAGIWKREGGRITPVVVFPERSAKYEKLFDFYGHAKRAALARFDANMRAAWALALRTAR
jgi:hypothetical protein